MKLSDLCIVWLLEGKGNRLADTPRDSFVKLVQTRGAEKSLEQTKPLVNNLNSFASQRPLFHLLCFCALQPTPLFQPPSILILIFFLALWLSLLMSVLPQNL